MKAIIAHHNRTTKFLWWQQPNRLMTSHHSNCTWAPELPFSSGLWWYAGIFVLRHYLFLKAQTCWQNLQTWLVYSVLLWYWTSNDIVNWHLSKQGGCWPVLCDYIVGSSLEFIEITCFLKLATYQVLFFLLELLCTSQANLL